MSIIENSQNRMNTAIEHYKVELSKIRAGRAHPGLVENIKVDYYGTPTELKQMSTISAPEALLITIQPYDPSQIMTIEKALQNSDQSLNPSNDGNIIRIPIAPLTEERRKELVKGLGKVAEEARVAVRNIRRDANESVKKSELPEDQVKKDLDIIQKNTDNAIKSIDQITKDKEKEILKI